MNFLDHFCSSSQLMDGQIKANKTTNQPDNDRHCIYGELTNIYLKHEPHLGNKYTISICHGFYGNYIPMFVSPIRSWLRCFLNPSHCDRIHGDKTDSSRTWRPGPGVELWSRKCLLWFCYFCYFVILFFYFVICFLFLLPTSLIIGWYDHSNFGL